MSDPIRDFTNALNDILRGKPRPGNDEPMKQAAYDFEKISQQCGDWLRKWGTRPA